MENPYISAIHTFPTVDHGDFPGLSPPDIRFGYVLIEFGPVP